MQEKENPICAYQNLNQQIELIKNELIRYLLFADCGDAVFEDQVDVFAEEINKFIEEKIKCKYIFVVLVGQHQAYFVKRLGMPLRFQLQWKIFLQY